MITGNQLGKLPRVGSVFHPEPFTSVDDAYGTVLCDLVIDLGRRDDDADHVGVDCRLGTSVSEPLCAIY